MSEPLVDKKLQKHTLHLYEGDYNKLRELYPELGAAVVIRQLVANFFKKIEKNPKSVPTDLDIDI